MTLGVLLVAATASACGRPCDADACAPVCAAIEAEREAQVPEGGDLLTAYELSILDQELWSYRRGIRPSKDRAIGLCKGVDRCDEPLVAPLPEVLPAGDYVAVGSLDVPELGTFEVTYVFDCVHRKPDEPPITRRTLTLGPYPELRTVDLGVLQKLHFRPAPEGEPPLECSVQLNLPGDEVWVVPQSFNVAGRL
ncbi:MAG: hypothetical protein H6733_07295 [Alphaproteobacteria bacterium]|nr:hypothetical protein [Alphaproteobacteria bacterium]